MVEFLIVITVSAVVIAGLGCGWAVDAQGDARRLEQRAELWTAQAGVYEAWHGNVTKILGRMSVELERAHSELRVRAVEAGQLEQALSQCRCHVPTDDTVDLADVLRLADDLTDLAVRDRFDAIVHREWRKS